MLIKYMFSTRKLLIISISDYKSEYTDVLFPRFISTHMEP